MQTDALTWEEKEDRQDGCHAEGQKGEDPPGDIRDRGGVVIRKERDDGVTQPESGIEEDEEEGCGYGFGAFSY
jgi:hypothetical protein